MGNLCTKVPEQAIAQGTLTTTNHTRTQQALGVSYTEIEEFKEVRMRVAGGNAETELTERLPQTPNQGPFRLNQERQALTDTQANKDREGDEKILTKASEVTSFSDLLSKGASEGIKQWATDQKDDTARVLIMRDELFNSEPVVMPFRTQHPKFTLTESVV